MNTCAKIWLTVAAVLTGLGLVLFTVAMAKLGWDFTKLGTVRYETNTYQFSQAVTHISVKTDTADVRFLPSSDGECQVVCHEAVTAPHAVSVADGTLLVHIADQRKWYDYIGLDFGIPKITVYLPEGVYGALTVKGHTGDVEIPQAFTFTTVDVSLTTGDAVCQASVTEGLSLRASTGDLWVKNLSAGTLTLSVSTGKITVSEVVCQGDVTVSVSTGKAVLQDTVCQNLLTTGDTGDLVLTRTVAQETFRIERDTGDVRFDGCDAGEIVVRTSTGDISGAFLSPKVFLPKTSTGRISVPKTVTGGRCEVTTSTGDIVLTVQ